MYCLVGVDLNNNAVYLIRSDCDGFFNKCCISVQWMGLVMIRCRGAVKRMGMLAVSVRKMKALTVKV